MRGKDKEEISTLTKDNNKHKESIWKTWPMIYTLLLIYQTEYLSDFIFQYDMLYLAKCGMPTDMPVFS